MDSFTTEFCEENRDLLFQCKEYAGEFFANAGGLYSKPNTKDTFSYGWAMQFPGGRYAIKICQRHSVYVDGEPQYINANFKDKKNERFFLDTLPEPGREDIELPEFFFKSLTHAQAYAAKYSKDGIKILIAKEWDIIDMY